MDVKPAKASRFFLVRHADRHCNAVCGGGEWIAALRGFVERAIRRISPGQSTRLCTTSDLPYNAYGKSDAAQIRVDCRGEIRLIARSTNPQAVIRSYNAYADRNLLRPQATDEKPMPHDVLYLRYAAASNFVSRYVFLFCFCIVSCTMHIATCNNNACFRRLLYQFSSCNVYSRSLYL